VTILFIICRVLTATAKELNFAGHAGELSVHVQAKASRH